MKIQYFGTTTNVVARVNDSVIEGRIIKQTISRDEDGNTTDIVCVIESDGKTFTTHARNVYDDINAYRKDEPKKMLVIDKTNFKEVYYYIEDGQVKQDKHDASLIIYKDHKFHFTDLDDDADIYTDKDVAEQMCTTTWVDDNGKAHTREGLLSLIMLDDDQKEAIEEYVAITKRLTDMGISIGYDGDDGKLYAWNERKVDMACPQYDGEDEVAYWQADDVIEHFRLPIDLFYICCDDQMNVRRKDESESK